MTFRLITQDAMPPCELDRPPMPTSGTVVYNGRRIPASRDCYTRAISYRVLGRARTADRHLASTFVESTPTD